MDQHQQQQHQHQLQKVSSDEMKGLGMEDSVSNSMVLNHGPVSAVSSVSAVSAGSGNTGTILLINSPNGPTHKRKNTSFKITNILPSRPPSNDPEESGEDDPDDSHTEDISDGQDMTPWSPSYNQPSRKLLSSMRRNSFDAAAAAAAACVAAGGTKEAAVSILSSNGLPASAMSVVLNEEVPVFSKNAKWVSSILAVTHTPHSHDARVGPRDRFKVVRMETNVPLKRGRWTCIDYIDKRSANVEKPNELNDNNGGEAVEEDRLLPPLTSANVPSSSVSLCNNSIAEPVRMSSNPTTPSVVQSPSSGHPPPVYSNSSSSQQQMLQHIYQKAAAPPSQQQQVIQFAAAGPKQQQQTASILLPQNSTNLVSSSAGSAGPVPSPQMSVHQHQQQIFLEGAPSASYMTPVSFSAGLLPSSSAVSSIPPSRAETTEMLPPASSSFYPAHFDHPIDNEHLVERLEEISTQQNAPNSVEEDIDNSCEIQNNGGGSSSAKARDGNHYAAAPSAANHPPGPYQQQQGLHHLQQRYVSRPELGTGHIPPGHSRYTSRGVSPTEEHHQHSSSLFASIYSASGTNQGAIDNRIEQAMDLVKSHLMNAVRSEVEELKERIVKLEDVISHLQNENDYLKANVSQEVLTQLPPPTSHHQILQQGPHNASSAGGGLSPTSSTLVVANQPASQQQQ